MAEEKKTQNGTQSAEAKALDQFADLMIEKIESINEDWKKPWFTEGTMVWPKNLSGRPYNGSNSLMLMLHQEKEGYKLPVYCTFNRVAGLNTFKDKNGQTRPAFGPDGKRLPTVSVKKGEKSFPVMLTTFTVVNKDTKEKIPYDDYKQLDEDEKKLYNVYPKQTVFNVFNVEQTNLEEARPKLYAKLVEQNQVQRPEQQKGKKFTFPAMDEMIAKDLWHCPIKPMHQDQAYYSISKDEIVVPEKKQFKDGESFYSTVLHEATHSTGKEALLNRFDEKKGWGTTENYYDREELVAEMGAALVASRYGMSKTIKEESASYLKSWLENMKESPDFIKTVLDSVRKATALVTQRIDLIQGQIESYRESTGEKKAFPERYDLEQDSKAVAVARQETKVAEPVEVEEQAEVAKAEVAVARGMHR